MRTVPQVLLSPCPPTYARLIAWGLDTFQEALLLTPSSTFVQLLETSQAAARELKDDLSASVEVQLGPERFQAQATGAQGGFRWRLQNDDILILIRSPKCDWSVSVRYTAAGLWEHGLEALRVRAFEALRPHTTQGDPDCIRVSRADYCFDFFSPKFSAEFEPGLCRNVVMHSSAKAHEVGYGLWSRGGKGETLTCGSKTGLQVEVYNKTLEIDEKSGKTWLYEIWLEGLHGEWVWDGDKPHDMWRVECRYSGDFLKDRDVRRPHEFMAQMQELIAEALYKRRLSVPSVTDLERWRWPMHPLWSEAARHNASEFMLPVGRKITGRRSALVELAEKSIAGALVSASVLATGDYSEAKVVQLMERARARIENDPRHIKKVLAAQGRYSDVEDAR